MELSSLPLAYIGPETILPLTSVAAGIVGFLLIFWNSCVWCIKRPFQFMFGRKPVPTPVPASEPPMSDASPEASPTPAV